MLFILTKTGPWKIPGDLWRVLGNSSYCSTSEISRKGSQHQGRLLWDDFFRLSCGERRRENSFVSESELSIPVYWYPPFVAYPAHFSWCQYKQRMKGMTLKEWTRNAEQSCTALMYPFWAQVILLSRGYDWQKKFWKPAIKSYIAFL